MFYEDDVHTIYGIDISSQSGCREGGGGSVESRPRLHPEVNINSTNQPQLQLIKLVYRPF